MRIRARGEHRCFAPTTSSSRDIYGVQASTGDFAPVKVFCRLRVAPGSGVGARTSARLGGGSALGARAYSQQPSCYGA